MKKLRNNKTCTACKIQKTLDQFHLHKLGAGEVASICKDCKQQLSRESNWRFREKIDVAQARIFWQSRERCKICNSTERLNLDHNHTTGNIRGILCNSCNQGLGLFKDDKELLLEAVKYLEETS